MNKADTFYISSAKSKLIAFNILPIYFSIVASHPISNSLTINRSPEKCRAHQLLGRFAFDGAHVVWALISMRDLFSFNKIRVNRGKLNPASTKNVDKALWKDFGTWTFRQTLLFLCQFCSGVGGFWTILTHDLFSFKLPTIFQQSSC